MLIFCALKSGAGWVDGWKGGRAGLRIAYSNNKLNVLTLALMNSAIRSSSSFESLSFFFKASWRAIVSGSRSIQVMYLKKITYNNLNSEQIRKTDDCIRIDINPDYLPEK